MILIRVEKLRAKVRVKTQEIRETLMLSMQELFDLAKQQAQNEKLELEQRQNWVRIAAYAAQVVNCLTKSFDEAGITQQLEKLERMIREAVAKEKGGRA